jgi:hypothetical protein
MEDIGQVRFNWMPVAGDAGSHTITLKATDSANGTAKRNDRDGLSFYPSPGLP